MIEKLVKRFVILQSEYGTIRDDDINVYQYGYTLMIEVILNLALSLVLGVLLRQIKEVIFFLCIFIPLRSFCGGYHTNKAWKCIILSNLTVIGVVVLSKLMVFNELPELIKNVIMVVAAFMIVMLAPVETQNRELSVHEKKIYKRYAGIIMFIVVIIEIALCSLEMVVYYHIVLMVQIIQLFSLVIVLVKSKFENK